MTRKTLALTTALLALANACGPPVSEGTGFDFRVTASAAASDLLSGFQVAVLADSSAVDCGSVQNKCLKNVAGFNASELVSISGADLKKHPALLFPRNLGASGEQAITVNGIPTGNHYAIFVEAVSTDHRFQGGFCGYQAQVKPEKNAASFVATLTLKDIPDDCEPLLDASGR